MRGKRNAGTTVAPDTERNRLGFFPCSLTADPERDLTASKRKLSGSVRMMEKRG